MKTPFWLNCWLKTLYRRGLRFQSYSEQLEHSYVYSPVELQRYQSMLLKKMVQHAYRNIPYYNKVFRENRLTPDSIQVPEDLKKLPMLDKKTVQENYDLLISRSHTNWLCKEGTTSGSTGMPAKFLRDYDAINFEHAIVWRHWRQAGDYGGKRVSLRGDIIVPASQDHPPFWRYDPVSQELQMSSYHLSLKNSIYYIEKILCFEPDILYCGPSMGHLLAKCFEYQNKSYQFSAIFTSSESLQPEVRDEIEQIFQCKIYDWYGQAERVVAVGHCPAGKLHLQEDYSIVELIPTEDSCIYEMVGTQLKNYVMPLLRYKTQDFTECLDLGYPNSPCGCGTSFRPVERIVGRAYGYLITPEGYHIAITAHIPVGTQSVLETQFYQVRQGEVILKVIPKNTLTEQDRQILINNTLKHTSPHMKVEIQEVSYIPRGPNGKFINIVNDIDSSTKQTDTLLHV